jgi:hypothetical protein
VVQAQGYKGILAGFNGFWVVVRKGLCEAVREVFKHTTAPAPSDRHDYLQVMIHAAMRTHGLSPVDPPKSMLLNQAATFSHCSRTGLMANCYASIHAGV